MGSYPEESRTGKFVPETVNYDASQWELYGRGKVKLLGLSFKFLQREKYK